MTRGETRVRSGGEAPSSRLGTSVRGSWRPAGSSAPSKRSSSSPAGRRRRRWIWVQTRADCPRPSPLSLHRLAVLGECGRSEGDGRGQRGQGKGGGEVANELADQEKRSRQNVGLQLAHWSIDEAIRLDESEGDSTGSFLWLGDAWNRLQKNGGYLPG